MLEIIHYKMVNFMVREFHLNKEIFFTKGTGSLTEWYAQEKQTAT